MKSKITLLSLYTCCAITAHAALSTNLIAYYNFEQTGTSGIANKVGNGTTHNGTYLSTAVAGTGAGFAGNAAFQGNGATNTTNRSTLLVGNALNVDSNAGSGGFNVSTLDTTSLGQNFSISAWFYMAPDADNPAKRPYVFEADSPANVYDVSYGSSTNVTSSSTTGNFIGYVDTSSATGQTVNVNTWNNVVHTFSSNGTTTTLTVYLNGANVATASATTSNMNFSGINFGYFRDGAGRALDGMLDEVALWDRTLTASEINNVNTGLAADSVYQRGLAGLAIPEPSAALLGGLGLMALLRRRR